MMNINSSDILTLDNNNEYVVVSKIVYNESEYIYLVNINDNSDIKFAEIENENGMTYITEINTNEIDLLEQLMPLFAKDSKEVLTHLKENND